MTDREYVETLITFTVNQTPVPQPRPHFRSYPLPNGKSATHAYVPSRHPIHAYRMSVLDAWREVMPSPGFRFDGPLMVVAEFITPRPESKRWKTREMPRMVDMRARKGDLDNLVKPVLDALSGKAYHDDSQIAAMTISKLMASGYEEPHVVVSIAPFVLAATSATA